MKHSAILSVLCLSLIALSYPSISNAGIGKLIGTVILKGGKIVTKSAAKGFAREFGTQVGKQSASYTLSLLAAKYPPSQHLKVDNNATRLRDGRTLYYNNVGNNMYEAYVGKPTINIDYQTLLQRERDSMTRNQQMLYQSYMNMMNSYFNALNGNVGNYGGNTNYTSGGYPDRNESSLGNYCCDGAGNKRCALIAPGAIGGQCFCVLQGNGRAC